MDKLKYFQTRTRQVVPRLPLEGDLDLTYRCNNNCLHCWLRLPINAPEKSEELSFDEIRRIADEARAMGTREWSISGGEPMLRLDFPEIFGYLTRKAVTYTINTNGTLITPKTAVLLKRRGVKLIALYGATAEVYDRVTGNPGGFEQLMRGLAYLKEAGAGFLLQLIPMRENWEQWCEMVEMARSLTSQWRIGAPWLYLSADGNPQRNAEIVSQRLDPADAAELEEPDLPSREWQRYVPPFCGKGDRGDDDRLFARCIAGQRKFHIDPYGGMTFCSYIKDASLRYDLRRGTFREAWELFIPSLGDRVRGGDEWRENCGSCEKRGDCRWCAVYGYIEHGDFSAKVDYLCSLARETRRYTEEWLAEHRRFYRVADITLQVDSEAPFAPATFMPKFEAFRVEGPGEDTVTLHHYFSLEGLQLDDLGKAIYRQNQWTIYRKGDAWIYLSMMQDTGSPILGCIAEFNHTHTRARIYHAEEEQWWAGGLNSLTLLPSDHILIARLLADRQGCCLHSAGAILEGKGLLFLGQSDAGKTTVTRLLEEHAEILCDERTIVRRVNSGFNVYGTWSHGDLPLVSPSSAPLRAILFINKSAENRLTRLENLKEIMRRLLPRVIKPLITRDWWEKTLDVVEALAREVPCYEMEFDKNGGIVKVLQDI